MNVLLQPSPIAGTLHVPASKSLSHRTLICSGLGQGVSTIEHLGDSKDIQATLSCLKNLGAKITIDPKTNLVSLQGCKPQNLTDPVTLDAYESGSTLRFFIPIAAAGQELVTFKGQPSLLARPLGVYETLFHDQNLRFDQSLDQLIFQGPLTGGSYALEGHISSQFISGMLLAAPLFGGIDLEVVGDYQSRSYVGLTVDMMRQFGIVVEELNDHHYHIAGDQYYQSRHVQVESDWSQAAFFLVLGMLKQSLTLTGLKQDSLQGDRVIFDFVQQAGGLLNWNEDKLEVSPHQMHSFTFDLADCPDLGPILCTLAAFVPGKNRLIHTARLRYKESDRVAAMEEELRKWGVEISSDEDSITIIGKDCYVSNELVTIDSHNDHRIVMAMAVFALCANQPCVIRNAQAVNKSYPTFFADLQSLGVELKEV